MTETGAEAYIDAFDEAQARDGRARIEDYLPPRDHADYLRVLCEIVRIDLEYAHGRGRPAPLDDYRRRFPALFEHPEHASAIAFEEDRLRRQPAGETPPAGDDVARAAWTYRSFGRRPGGDGADALGVAFLEHSVSRESAALFRDLHESDPLAADRLARAVTTLPLAGSEFLGFHLEGELGRGAFGRVFLARQGDLAGRRVALKVSADVGAEASSLAQLQHTNIVPIYSLHRSGPLRAVCMPFLGSVTLADVLGEIRLRESLPDSGAGLLSSLRSVGSAMPASPDAGEPSPQAAPARPTAQIETLRRLGYVPAVLWIGRRLADGLAHAHERGILHRDLKPANILFSEGGEPVLLDFNLAADTKVPASVAQVGGTLPYMAPEQLEAFRDDVHTIDERGDIFSLGVVLCELLTGRIPYPVHRGTVDEVLPAMIADRRSPPPALRPLNRAITPAVEAIVLRCLQPDPVARYASARELAEDLQRQLDDLPLKHTREPSLRERVRKWARRHPRLTSMTTLAIVSASLLAGLAAGFLANRRHVQGLEAERSLRILEDDRERASELLAIRSAEPQQIAEGVALCRASADRYGVLSSASWIDGQLVARLSTAERSTLRARIGEMLYLWARAEVWKAEDANDPARRGGGLALAERLNVESRRLFGDAAPRSVLLQAADLAGLDGRAEEAERLRTQARAVPIRTAHEGLLTLSDRLNPEIDREAVASIRAIADRSPNDVLAWLLLANRYSRLGRMGEAIDALGYAIALRPDDHWAYFLRGVLAIELVDYARAREDFDRVLARRPDLLAARINRALARLGLGDARGAIADLDTALERADAPTRALFIRAIARDRVGDRDGAARDRAEGLRRRPNDPESWVARGLTRLPDDPQGALADMDEALLLDARHREALQNRASILSERLGRPDEAIRTLDRLLKVHPHYVPGIAGRGVLLARKGRREEALRDARAALEADPRPATLYQVAGLYALTSRAEPSDRREAFRLLSSALRGDPAWLNVVPSDADLDPIREAPEFAEILRSASVLAGAGSIR